MSRPESVSKMVIACCVLHNIAIRNGQPLDVDEEGDNRSHDGGEGDTTILGAEHGRPYHRGVSARQDIVDAYF